MSAERQPLMRPLELSDAVALIKLIDAGAFGLRCTAADSVGAVACGIESPPAPHPTDARDLALAAGWRVWGPEDTELFNGEVLCPKHRDHSIAAVMKRHVRGE